MKISSPLPLPLPFFFSIVHNHIPPLKQKSSLIIHRISLILKTPVRPIISRNRATPESDQVGKVGKVYILRQIYRIPNRNALMKRS